MEPLTPTPRAIQHVTKASSDQLLRKFAAIDSDSDSSDNDEASSSARKSISRRCQSQKKRKVMMKKEMSPSIENNSSSASFKVVERKSLLPQYYQRGSSSTSRRTSSSGASLLKKIGISKSHPSYARVARDFRTKSLLSAIEKTWSKTVRGASKIFMEKHYNRHRILIDDMV